MKPRNYGMLIPVFITTVMAYGQANAACSRSDVEFYLDKGFSTDQITELCKAPSGVADDIPVQQLETGQRSGQDVVGDNEQFLKVAIKGSEIYLTSESLHYTRKKMCIEYFPWRDRNQ